MDNAKTNTYNMFIHVHVLVHKHTLQIFKYNDIICG